MENKFEKIYGGGVCTPLGFTASACSADIKGKSKGNKDLAVLLSDAPCNAAAVFTANLVKAAPVVYSMEILKEGQEVYGVVANSGNANACTGKTGYEACVKITQKFEEILELPEKSLYIASTGVIGNRFPTQKVLDKAVHLVELLDDDGGEEFATAIMTTDTVKKETAMLVNTDKGSFVIGGACKGAGMIDPSMATLLSFVTTDASVDKAILQMALTEAVNNSFNNITVDGDMSTNDTLFLFANGMSDIQIKSEKEIALFTEALKAVCLELALMIVKDGEGATKLVTIKVKGAADDKDARLCANKIANSPLVKTMFAGCDPNWGRLMSSLGASGAVFDHEKVSIWFNDLHYVENGSIIDTSLEEKAYIIMREEEYTITLDLKAGKGAAVCYTCDFTADYVKINADYRS